MPMLQSCVKKFSVHNIIECIKAEISFPKIVIFENKKTVHILDVTDIKDIQTNVHLFESEIVHQIIYNQNVWIILKSGELFVVNLKKGTVLEIKCKSNAHYQIQKFAIYESKLILISKSGERLVTSFNNEALEDEFLKGTTEMCATLEKAPISLNATFCDVNKNLINGVNICIDSEKLIIKCPFTGLADVITLNPQLQHVTLWNEMIVIATDVKMWIQSQNFDFISEFGKTGVQYFPLASNGDILYYITWNKEEIELNIASLSTCAEDKEDNNYSIGFKPKLSSQDSLKLQLKSLIDEILSHCKTVDQVLPHLHILFSEIDDYDLLIKAASVLCNHNLLYKPIVYPLQKRIYATGDENYINFITDLIIKIDLLEYICFKGGNCYEGINIFEQKFVELCITFISKSDLDLATICWLKYIEIKYTLNSDEVNNILNAIPYNIKMGALMIWFRNFIPPLLDHNPFYIDLFVKWTTDRVFLLEQSSYWPKIGLKFITAIIDVLETSIKTICVRPISIDDLDIIKDHISYIMELKEKYKINMLLSEFSSQSPSEIALIMLRRCYTEDLQVFLQKILPSYTSRHLLEIDNTLRSFVESEAASSGGCFDGIRLEILLKAFHSSTNRLDCLLNVLKILEVPWDTNVLTTATTAAALAFKDFTLTEADHALAHEIYKELNYSKIKVILKKYNFHLTCTDYTLVIHRLLNSPIVDLNDLKVITSILTYFANYANALYIDRCLQDCDTKLALEYYKNLPMRNQRILIKTILHKYEQIIASKSTNPLLERNYIDFLKGSLILDNIEINTIENLYYLKNSYKVMLNLNSINSNKCRVIALNNLKQSEEVLSSSGRGSCISQLISGYSHQQSKLMSLLRRTSSGQNVRVILEFLILNNPLNDVNNLSVLSQYKDGQNSTLLLESFEILSEVLSNCEEEHLHNLLKYLSILNALINASIVLKNLSVAWKFQYIFLPISSLNSLNDLINYYVATENIFMESTTIFNKIDFIPFRIIAHSLKKSTNTNTVLHKSFFKMREQVTKRLIAKIVALKDFDQVLVTSLLLTLQNSDLTGDNTWVLELLRGQSESLSPVIMHYLSTPLIRRTFSLDNILPGSTFSYPPQYILKSKFNINLSEIALPENSEQTWDVKVLLFYILRNYQYTTFERLCDLCQTLNITQNDGFSLLLVSILTNWDLKYKIVENEVGLREIRTENDFSQLMSKCVVIWHSIEDKIFLKDILNDFWKNGEVIIHGCLVSINPYYYEVYLCIYEMMFAPSNESKNLKEYYLLNFLKGYQRKSNPKQYEFELFSVKGMFPEIGYYRLPFHLFMRDDMWSNLKSEITLQTYESWLPVVGLLSLDGELQTARDMVCSNAVKQTMTNRKQCEGNDIDSKDNEPWQLSSSEEPLLRTAHKCVRHIANMEWAGACLFYVLQGCARGADQVAAAQLCYQFSQRWATLQPGNRAVRQMERLHSTLSTRHALHKIEWACEELIKLSSEPAQLIHALYVHPNFVGKISRHDINRTANEIADKNGVNISSIRIQILENILEKVYKDNKSSHGLEIKDLITAKYILKATCPKMGAIYLSRIAFDDESDHNKCKRLRALQCLISVIDADTAIKFTNRQRNTLWTSLLELLYVVKLEKIDVPWVVATFMQNKALSLNQLLQVSGNNVECLKIAAELAHKFGTVHVMREMIPMLLRASLFEGMIPLLLQVQNPPDNIIYSAWRAIILYPFQRADYPITERQKMKCLNALNLLPVCPVIKDEDLIEIWKHCVRCKCLGLGCLILPYMSSETRKNLSELHRIDKRNLIISLKNLHSESYLVSGAMYVIEHLTSKSYK